MKTEENCSLYRKNGPFRVFSLPALPSKIKVNYSLYRTKFNRIRNENY
jgi:hypothetical protein